MSRSFCPHLIKRRADSTRSISFGVFGTGIENAIVEWTLWSCRPRGSGPCVAQFASGTENSAVRGLTAIGEIWRCGSAISLRSVAVGSYQLPQQLALPLSQRKPQRGSSDVNSLSEIATARTSGFCTKRRCGKSLFAGHPGERHVRTARVMNPRAFSGVVRRPKLRTYGISRCRKTILGKW